MHLAVVGAGYVGAVTATCFSAKGHRTTLIEADPSRLSAMMSGRIPFHEPGLSALFAEMLANGRQRVSGDAQALADHDLVLICVGTPLAADGEADLRQIEAACHSVALHAPGVPVIVRSTMPLGTSDRLGRWLERSSLDLVATNPEFLRQGSAVKDFLNPTRIVVGSADGKPSPASHAGVQAYAGFDAPVILTDFASAEMIKNAANGFLAMKLSFMNEIADLCEAYGADVEQVAAGIGSDPRIGHDYLRPGIGFGGSCLPKELANLVRIGRRRDLPMSMLGAAGRTNDERPGRIADRIESITGSVFAKRIALLGLAFKPDTDDTRYSPAVALARILIDRGAEVVAHDPAVPGAVSDAIDGLARAESVAAAVDGAELVVLATEWSAYQSLDWRQLGRMARVQTVFDGRNALDPALLAGAGWRVIRVGTADRLPLPDPSPSADVTSSQPFRSLPPETPVRRGPRK